jgi:enterobacterial common antigen flippase
MSVDPPTPLGDKAIEASLAGRETPADRSSYREILKSSAVIGGASLVTIAVGIVRTKATAVLLGPAGLGLMGAYLLIVDLSKSIAQFGINSSGVRQIAEAAGSNDLARTARTAIALRTTAIVCAGLGALSLWLLAPAVSEMTFGSPQYGADVAMLSIAVFLSVIAAGQVALVQGMRRVADLSKIGIISTVVGAVMAIVLLYHLRERGIVLSLIAAAALSVAIGWWYRRKIELPATSLTLAQTATEAGALLKLGLAFMASGLMMLGTNYVVRVMVLRQSGLDAAGLYQAAWTLGGLYVGFILQAMGTDFYPRLVALIGKLADCNRLVNEQAHVSLLLAGPGVVGTLALAPMAIELLYSTRFEGAVEPLRWICLGMALRVISWPMGFIVVAGNYRALFFGTELAWATFNVTASWLLVDRFGATGAGIAFFLSYVFHCLMIYLVVARLSGFRWSTVNLRLGAGYIVLCGVTMVLVSVLPSPWALAVGVLAIAMAGSYSWRSLSKLVVLAPVPKLIRRMLSRATRKAGQPLDPKQEGPVDR